MPSHITLVGTRALISYEGHPINCYGCNKPGHQYQEGPFKKTTRPINPPSTDSMTSCANIVQLGAPKKLPEQMTKETSTVKDTNKINSFEEDRQLAGEETHRCRKEKTPPRESWTALIDEENSRDLEIHRHQ